MQGTAPDNGFLLCTHEERSETVKFTAEDSRSPSLAPRLSVSYFRSGVSGFKYVFDPNARETWTYGSVEPVSFEDGDLNLIPGACLVTKDRAFNDCVITGEFRRTRGAGSVTVSLAHPRLGRYNIVLGDRCGVAFDQGGNLKVTRLWEAPETPDLSDWCPFEVSVNRTNLYVRIGAERSGALESVDVRDTGILVKSEGCYGSFRNLVVGTARKE